jgi:hypothetical protein
MTCDQLPANTDADMQAKFNCLNDKLATATDALKLSLAARIELLLQLAGERLTQTQRERAEHVYDENPAAATSCSVPLVWDSACQTQAGALGLPTQLQLCQDLAQNDHTSPGAAGAEAQHCLDELAKTAQIQINTCRLSTRDAADNAAQGVIGKASPPLTGNLITLLPTVLSRINAWWTAAAIAAAGDQSWLLGHANTLLRQLQASIETGKTPLPNGSLATDAEAEALLADVDGTRFAADFDLLTALFATGQGASPPLLTLTGDALQAITDRLARLEALHDVGCRFAAGDPSIACRVVSGTTVTLRSSATSELVHALSVLSDHDALASVLSSATKLATQQPEMFVALTRIRDQHNYFDLAWTALGRTEPFAQLATIPDPPAQAAALAAVVRGAAIAWSSYQGSGEFIPWHRARLTAATLERSALVGFVDSLISHLVSERTNFEGARLNTVNDLLAEIHQQATIQNVLDRMTVLRDQDADLVARSLGMESREAAARSSLAGYQATFEALVASHALDSNASYQTQTITPIFASAASAHYPGGAAAVDLGRDRLGPPIALHSGDSLRLKVSGTWAPTCAVLSAQIQGPDGGFRPIAAPDAETGPEGYWVSLTNGDFKSHSTAVVDDWRASAGISTKACVGGALSTVAHASWEACLHADFDVGHTHSVADSNGSDSRSTASFASGIHLDSTPFPQAPAGSLLAVVTPSGRPDKILDVRVVLRDDLIVAPTPPAGFGNQIDVSLVVNDLGTCGNPSISQLQIEGVKSIPLGNIAQALGVAMSSTLTAIEAQAPAILAQGQLTVEEAAALRTQAWTMVQQGILPLGFGLASLPYDLRQLFDSFLETEIASIARRGEMHAITRERTQLELSADSLAHEAAFADAENRLLLLVPRWRLRDLTGVSLANATDALSEALTTDVAQVFELRDPATFSNFRTQFTSSVNQLIDVKLTEPYETTLKHFEDFANAARNVVSQATFELPTTQRRNVVLSIPRTPTLCSGAPCDHGNFRSVSSTVAGAFWSALAKAPFQAGLTITPSDLYSDEGTGSFSCGDVAPIVRRIAMYLDTADSTIDLTSVLTEARGTAAMAGAPVAFPRVGDVLSLDADSPAGVALALPVLNGDVLSVPNKFGPSPNDLGAGGGLSPFTTFRFDMTPFQTGVPKAAMGAASAVLLVFEVERRVSVPNVDVPGVCQPTLP